MNPTNQESGKPQNVSELAQRKLEFPPMAIAHVLTKLEDLYFPYLTADHSIEVNTTWQPNSRPHFGTMLTLALTFSIAKHCEKASQHSVTLLLDELENSPDPQAKITSPEGWLFQRSLADAPPPLDATYRDYRESFSRLLSVLGEISEVNFSKRSYREFQADPVVREALAELIAKRDAVVPIISPSTRELHIRAPCPRCRFVDKYGFTNKYTALAEGRYELSAHCFQCGPHTTIVAPDTADYVDTNAAIRDVIKGVIAQSKFTDSKVVTIMCDGGDWGGNWALTVFSRALTALGKPYNGHPVRIYAPLALDWSGAKFSKTLYVGNSAYGDLPRELLDADAFTRKFGVAGIRTIVAETDRWVREPKRLFRDYSVEYFLRLLA